MSEQNAPQAVEAPSVESVAPDSIPQWSDWTRRVVTVGLVIATVYALTLLLPALQLLITTFLLTFLLYLPARFLAERTHLTFVGSVVLIYALLVLSVIVFILAFVPGFLRGVSVLTNDLQEAVANVRAYVDAYEFGQGEHYEVLGVTISADPLVEQVKLLFDQLAPDSSGASVSNSGSVFNLESAGTVITSVTRTVTGAAGDIGGFIVSLLLAIFLSFLFLIDLHRYEHSLLEMIPRPYHREVRVLADKILALWKGFFRGQVIIALIIGVFTGAQLAVMGISQAGILAVFTAFISLIPSIGGIIALIPLALVPLLQGSTVLTDMPNETVALLVVVINLVFSQIVWGVIAPRLLGDAVALPVPIILIGIVIGTAIGGVFGAFLIVPILGTLRLLVLYVLAKLARRDPFPAATSQRLREVEQAQG